MKLGVILYFSTFAFILGASLTWLLRDHLNRPTFDPHSWDEMSESMVCRNCSLEIPHVCLEV